MSGMKQLVQLMKQLEDQLVVCMRCGMCQSVCPLYAETGLEADVARGKLALLDGLLQEMFRDSKGVYERLNRCLLCGSCAANCPSGVKALDIFMKARAILTGYMGLSPVKRAVLRGMLAHPEIFDRITEWAARFQELFTNPVDDLIGTSCARFMSPLIADRHFVPLAKLPFHRKVPFLHTSPKQSGIKVGFFVGCLIDKVFPHVAEAVIAVLEHHGIGIWMPENQGCCGIPAIASGDMTTFTRLVHYNLERFESENFDYLVTACATCTSTIKKVWPVMAREGSRDLMNRIEKMADRTLDIHQLLVSKLDVKKDEVEKDDTAIKITYHDPCHLKKSLGVASEPRILIQANPRYRLKEMAEADRCCGLGGSFSLEHYKLSASIGKIKRDHIKASECSVVATGCPACMIQLSDMLSQWKDPVQIKHAIEIYADGVKNIAIQMRE